MRSLDSTKAWHGAKRMVSANREAVAAVAGVFFLLPALISVVVLPTPAIDETMNPQQLYDAIMRFYADVAPILMALTLPMMVGYLTLLMLLVDRARPTVGRAIVLSLQLLPGYFVAQIIVALAIGAFSALLSGVLAHVLPAAAALALAVAAMLYLQCRVVLIAPEVVAQRRLNPLAAINAATAHTRGQAWHILLYLGPALVLYAVICMLVMILASVLLIPVTSDSARQMLGESVAALLLTIGYTWYAALVASTYQQLATRDEPAGAI